MESQDKKNWIFSGNSIFSDQKQQGVFEIVIMRLRLVLSTWNCDGSKGNDCSSSTDLELPLQHVYSDAIV